MEYIRPLIIFTNCEIWIKQIAGDHTVLLDHCIVSDPMGENIVKIFDSPPSKANPIVEFSSECSGCCSVGDNSISL
jgi:hypothetical protein